MWVCELEKCGHVWLAVGDIAPDKCGKCQKRHWHVTKATSELIREKSLDIDDRIRRIVREEIERLNQAGNLPVARHNVPEPVIIPPPRRVDMEALRDIAAGITSPPTAAAQPVFDRPMCEYAEPDYETGETYRCGLPVHSAKIRHTRGPKV